MTYREVYNKGVEQLKAAGVAEAELDARLMLEFVCHTDRNYMLTYGDERVTNELEEIYVNYIQERCKRIPMQYILNEAEFMGLSFYVNQDVLIPRQDTECLVEEAMKEVHDGMSVLDMCAGSGCIIISLMKYKNDIRGVAVDISDKALGVARHNSLTHGVTEQLRLVESDLFQNGEEIRRALSFLTEGDGLETTSRAKLSGESEVRDISGLVNGSEIRDISGLVNGSEVRDISGLVNGSEKQGMTNSPNKSEGQDDRFDCIISNPPYIKSDIIDKLAPEVKDNEPLIALDGTADGLYFYREIAKEAPNFLVSGGMLFFEIGFDQGTDVMNILIEHGYTDVKVTKDLAGLDRVVSARYLIR